jgi:hypothetical protein
MNVLNIRLKLRGSLGGIGLDHVVLTEPLVAAHALDQGVGEGLDVAGGLPHPRRHDDRGILADDVLPLLDDVLPPGALDVVLELDAERAVVPARPDRRPP